MNQSTKFMNILEEDGRDDDLIDAARLKIAANEPLTKAEANAYFAASLHNPTNQVYFRAGLIACREYMARFVESESPTIAASIRANWWPQLGNDYGPPRLLDLNELAEGEPQLGNFRVKTENWTPTLEALPIAAQFLQAPIPGPASEESLKAAHTHGVQGAPQDDFGQPIVYDTNEVDEVTHALTGDDGEDDSVTVLRRFAAYVQNVWPGKTAMQVLIELEEGKAGVGLPRGGEPE